MIRLDAKDRKLLSELENNARQPNTVIGRKIGLKSDVVQYRINRLKKRGVLSAYLGYINFHKIGYIDFGLYVSLVRCSSEQKKRFIELVKGIDNVSYFANLGGNFDFIIGILARNSLEFHSIANKINNEFGEYINEKEYITRISLHHFQRKYLAKFKGKKTEFYFGGELGNYSLDDLDKKILFLLATNARMKIIDIASNLEQPHSTIMSRIKKLEKAKVIRGYYALIDSEKYGYLNYNLTLKVKNIQSSDEKKLFAYCKQCESITWFIRALGPWDYEIGIEVENQENLQKLINDLRDVCPQIIKLELCTIFKTLKYSLYPFKE